MFVDLSGVENELPTQEIPKEHQNTADELGDHKIELKPAGKQIHQHHGEHQTAAGDGGEDKDFRGGAHSGVHRLEGKELREQKIAGDSHQEGDRRTPEDNTALPAPAETGGENPPKKRRHR